MDVRSEIEQKFANVSPAHASLLSCMPDSDPAWAIRLPDGRFGVGVPYEGETVAEEFAGARLHSAKRGAMGAALPGLLMLTSADEQRRNEFSLLCSDFVDPGPDGRRRQSLLEQPLNWWENWRELLGNAVRDMQPHAVLGELLIYEHLLATEKRVVWSGPDGSSHDLQYRAGEAEVKTTLQRYGSLVHISGHFQLQTETDLFLYFCRLEPGANGTGIDDVVNRLSERPDVSRDMLNAKLASVGYVEGNSARRERFTLLEVRRYRVDKRFPQILPESFVGGSIPVGIRQISYAVDLSAVPGETIRLPDRYYGSLILPDRPREPRNVAAPASDGVQPHATVQEECNASEDVDWCISDPEFIFVLPDGSREPVEAEHSSGRYWILMPDPRVQAPYRLLMKLSVRAAHPEGLSDLFGGGEDGAVGLGIRWADSGSRIRGAQPLGPMYRSHSGDAWEVSGEVSLPLQDLSGILSLEIVLYGGRKRIAAEDQNRAAVRQGTVLGCIGSINLSVPETSAAAPQTGHLGSQERFPRVTMQWPEMDVHEADEICSAWQAADTERMISDMRLHADALPDAADLRRAVMSACDTVMKRILWRPGAGLRGAYEFDLEFGLELHRILAQFGFSAYEASRAGIWRYLTVNIMPDIVARRLGQFSRQRFFSTPRRSYLRMIWWYVHLSLQTDDHGMPDYAATRGILEGNSTDTIQQLVDRCGGGYPLELYREIMRQHAVWPSAEENRKRDVLRAVLEHNVAYSAEIEPMLYEGGAEQYVRDLFACAFPDNAAT